jgi:hypothetical protein
MIIIISKIQNYINASETAINGPLRTGTYEKRKYNILY